LKKRRRSHDLLQEKARRRFLKNRNRRRKNFGHARLLNLPPGEFVVKFPTEIDSSVEPKKWLDVFGKLAFPQKTGIILDMKQMVFAYPEAFVYLAAVLDRIMRITNVTVREISPSDPKFGDYLIVCGLRKFFMVAPDREFDPSFYGDCIPISRDESAKTSTSHKIAEMIGSRLGFDGDLISDLGHAVGEILGNALEHSTVKYRYRICQVHDKRKLITLAIADNGIGIPRSLKEGYLGDSYAESADCDLIELSLDSSTTRYEPKPGRVHGMGLSVVQNFVAATDGRLVIMSGRGYYSAKAEGGKFPQVEKFDFEKELIGTIVVLRIPFE
jgi:signal transduction histidine kinase